MELQTLKTLLEEKRADLIEILDNMKNEIDGISRCEAKDDLDFASYSNDASRDFLIYKNQNQELQEINYALNKFREGNYGICEMCDSEIAYERLEIKPHAKYCVECKSMMMKGRL